MKKRILLFTAIAGMGYMVLSSNSSGPANGSGGNRTGALGSTANCGGSGCHGTGTSTTVSITVDSGTTAVTHYKPGLTYTIKIHGTNTSSLPKYGFEFAAVSGAGVSQIQAGTYPVITAPLFADVLGPVTYIEQGSTLTGVPAGTYDQSFQWKAPTTAVGNITLYCTLNAVNGDGNQDALDISGNTSVVLIPAVTTAVATVQNDLSISAFPNPAINNLNLQLNTAGTYTLQAINLNGSTVATQTIEVNNASATATINTTSWTPGVYNLVVTKDGNSKSIVVVKQ
jgi:hypothetical protein